MKISNEKRDAIFLLLEAGAKTKYICEALNVSAGAVSNLKGIIEIVRSGEPAAAYVYSRHAPDYEWACAKFGVSSEIFKAGKPAAPAAEPDPVQINNEAQLLLLLQDLLHTNRAMLGVLNEIALLWK